MSCGATREWRFCIDDMISFAEKVIAYTDGFDRDRFIASGLNYDATLRNLELIGEAASHVPEVALNRRLGAVQLVDGQMDAPMEN